MDLWAEVDRLRKEEERLHGAISSVEQQQQRLETGDRLKDDFAQQRWDSLEAERSSLTGQLKQTEIERKNTEEVAKTVDTVMGQDRAIVDANQASVEPPAADQKRDDEALARTQDRSEERSTRLHEGFAKGQMGGGKLDKQVDLIEQLSPSPHAHPHVTSEQIGQEVQTMTHQPSLDGHELHAPTAGAPDAALLMGGMVAAHVAAVTADRLGSLVGTTEKLGIKVGETMEQVGEAVNNIKETMSIESVGYENLDLDALKQGFEGMRSEPPLANTQRPEDMSPKEEETLKP
jgi:hypothetical protein